MASPREAVARCLADIENFPDGSHYALADDVLLALENAGYEVREIEQEPCHSDHGSPMNPVPHRHLT